MDIRIVDSEDILIDADAETMAVENSTGVIRNQEGGELYFSNKSEFQIINSLVDKIEVEDSTVELYDTIAREILEVTEGEVDPVSQNLQYFAEATLNTQDPTTKANAITVMMQYIQANEKHIRRLGYLATLDWLRRLLGL